MREESAGILRLIWGETNTRSVKGEAENNGPPNMTDYFTKWPEAYALLDHEVEIVAESMAFQECC